MTDAPYLAAAWLFVVGLYGVVTSRHLVHLTICLTVMQSSTYVLLIAIGFRHASTAPIFTGIGRHAPAVDPIVQALALTDVVVSVVVAALLLSLAINVHRRRAGADPESLRNVAG